MTLLKKLEKKEKEREAKSSTLFWRPSPGDILEGVIKDIGQTITFRGKADYMDVETSNGTVAVFLSQYLKHLVREENAAKGDRIAIKYLGLKKSTKNPKRQYKDYVVAVEKAEK